QPAQRTYEVAVGDLDAGDVFQQHGCPVGRQLSAAARTRPGALIAHFEEVEVPAAAEAAGSDRSQGHYIAPSSCVWGVSSGPAHQPGGSLAGNESWPAFSTSESCRAPWFRRSGWAGLRIGRAWG